MTIDNYGFNEGSSLWYTCARFGLRIHFLPSTKRMEPPILPTGGSTPITVSDSGGWDLDGNFYPPCDYEKPRWTGIKGLDCNA